MNNTIKVGDKFGNLEVVNIAPYLYRDYVSADMIECRCSCGAICLFKYHAISHRKNCGSNHQRRKEAALRQLKKERNPIEIIIQSYKKSAKDRNRAWLLEDWLVKAIVTSPCAYCGIEKDYNGIDRVDSSIGYIDYNCLPCCTMCNRAKSNHDVLTYLNNILATCIYQNLHTFLSLLPR